MYTSRSETILPGAPADVLELLTEPSAIARWAPIPFEVLELDGRRLSAGGRAVVAGRLAGRAVEFDVRVLDASPERFALVADGPIALDVEYRLRPADDGSAVDAAVSVRGTGLGGRLLAKATESLLAAGALRVALERLRHELPRALARATSTS